MRHDDSNDAVRADGTAEIGTPSVVTKDLKNMVQNPLVTSITAGKIRMEFDQAKWTPQLKDSPKNFPKSPRNRADSSFIESDDDNEV